MKRSFGTCSLIISITIFSFTNYAHAIDRTFTTVTISNDATEQDIYNFTVPANLLANARGIRLLIWGTHLSNTVLTRTIRVRGYYGSNLVVDGTSQAIAGNATVGDVIIEFVLFNTFATNTQKGTMRVIIQRLNQTTFYIYDIGTSATDSTADQTLRVTVTHSAANANITFVKRAAHAMLL